MITYVVAAKGVYLLMAYAKNSQGDLTPDQASALRRMIDGLS